MNLNSRQLNHLKLCIDEAASNVNRHAYSGMKVKKPMLLVEMQNAPEYVEIRVIDWGKIFSVDTESAKGKVDLEKYVETQRKGGLGLYMIHKFMDYVEWKREKDRNILIMRQNVKRPEAYWKLFKKNLAWNKMSLKVKFSLISGL